MTSAHGGVVGATLELLAPVLAILVVALGPVLRRRSRDGDGAPPAELPEGPAGKG